MNFATLALIVAAIGVNFGWQPSPDDPQAYEVLMQVEPELVDVLARGREIPIESHVPATVAPIRNIRVVVGTEELPRTMIAASDRPKSPADRIVRGQEPDPIEHTANFQNDPWGNSRSDAADSANRQYDQRGATIGVEPIRTAEASPWTVQGAQQTINNVGNSVRTSVGSSIDQVDRQFSQVGQELAEKTENVANEFGNQLQNLTGFGGQATPSTSASSTPATSAAGRSNWAAPPLATPSQPVTPIEPGWTSIRPELAPPRLTTPPLAGGVRVAGNPATSRTNAGPSFPAPPTTASSQQRSLLADPSRMTAGSEEEGDWNSPWSVGSTNPSASGDDLSGVGMVPVPPRIGNSSVSQTTRLSSPPSATSANAASQSSDNRYLSAGNETPFGNQGASDWANYARDSNSFFDDPRLPESAPQTPATPVTKPQDSSFAGQGEMTQPTIGTRSSERPPGADRAQGDEVAKTPDDVPWKPLLAVSLALAGSIGANFYLGMSYAEARRRYRSLVAKTTHAFEKKAGLAA